MRRAASRRLDGDGRIELVVSTENADGKHGVVRPIGGRRDGTNDDLVRLIDLDGDGDRDALTCEERDGFGVIWYEDPSR